MKQSLFFPILCVIFIFIVQKLWGCNFHLFEATSPAYYVNDEIKNVILAPNKWMYSVFWIDPVSCNGLTRSLSTTYNFTDRRFNDPEKAIHLFADIFREHIKKINSIRILRPFLYEFPMTPATCKLNINFFDNNGKFYSPPLIAHVFANGQFLSCAQYEKNRPAGLWFVDIYKKPLIELEEFKILYQQGLPHSKSESHPKVPVLKEIRHSLFRWMSRFCTCCDLVPLAIGPIGESVRSNRPFNFVVMGHQRLSFKEAHQLGVRCFNECFNYIKTDEDSSNFLKTRSTWPHEIYPSPIPIPEHIAFRISFWDENIDRPVQPYIAEIRYFDGIFTYYTADEVQRLILVHEETFDEAMKFLEQATVTMK